VLLIAIAGGGLAAATFAQYPEHVRLPGLDVRITTSHPPALRHEHRPPSPGPDYVWVGGFWDNDGGHWNWVQGHWDRPADTGVYWIAPRYVRSEGAYIYEPGHWSNQTLVVGDDVRSHRAWRRHEREHEHEMEREHHDQNRDHDRDH
jgi:hypothetical protein